MLEGSSAVDESMLTGESRLVLKSAGSPVTGGTINYEGPVTVRATATGGESTLAGIARLVAQAQSREAPIQRLADSVAGRCGECCCRRPFDAMRKIEFILLSFGLITLHSTLDIVPPAAIDHSVLL